MKIKYLLLLVSISLGCLGWIPESYGARVHGVFRVIKGKVEVKSGKNGRLTKARLGQKVYPRDTVITAKDARAKIIMVDKNEINISPESQLTIENYEFQPKKNKKNVLLNVLYGKVRSKVNQKYNGDNKFQIKTPSAVAGVRGTDFFTSFEPKTQTTNVVTFEGQVAFGLPGPNGAILKPVMVRVGQITSNAMGAAPAPPTQLPRDQLARMDQSSDATRADGSSNDSGQDRRTPAAKEEKKKRETKRKEPIKKDDQANGKKEPEAKKDSPQKREAGNGPNGQPKGDQNKSPEDQTANRNGPQKPDSANTGKGPRNPASVGAGGPRPPAGGAMMPPAGGPGEPIEGSGPMPGASDMFRPEDLAGHSGDDFMMPILEPGFEPPPIFDIPIPDQFVECDEFCRGVVEDGTTRLIIRVHHQSQ